LAEITYFSSDIRRRNDAETRLRKSGNDWTKGTLSSTSTWYGCVRWLVMIVVYGCISCGGIISKSGVGHNLWRSI